MNLREVTIGRAKNCDIYLDPRCKYASNVHARIYLDGTQLMYKDTSSNGTLINNINIKNRAVPIRRGDIIMLAGQYQLNWNQIDVFFPELSGMRTINTERVCTSGTQIDSPALSVQPDLTKWSWGAFVLYPIWGFFNGAWWGILIALFCFWLSPIPNIMFGIMGRRLAWNSGNWANSEDFERSQKSWDTAGIILFCLDLVFMAFFIILLFA